jgi:hypothetical protein
MQRVTLIRNAILLLALWGFIPYASGGSDQHQLDIPAQVSPLLIKVEVIV